MTVAQEGAENPWPPLSGVDRDILTRTLYGEARGEPEEGQIAVCHVIRNRVVQRVSTAAGECQRPYQFSCWLETDPNRGKLDALRPSDPVYQALAAVADKAWSIPDTMKGARHYFALSMRILPAWAKPPGHEVARIGGHSFWAGVA
jgi:N-acetylmuramoyl-L-alanine amidase